MIKNNKELLQNIQTRLSRMKFRYIQKARKVACSKFSNKLKLHLISLRNMMKMLSLMIKTTKSSFKDINLTNSIIWSQKVSRDKKIIIKLRKNNNKLISKAWSFPLDSNCLKWMKSQNQRYFLIKPLQKKCFRL